MLLRVVLNVYRLLELLFLILLYMLIYFNPTLHIALLILSRLPKRSATRDRHLYGDIIFDRLHHCPCSVLLSSSADGTAIYQPYEASLRKDLSVGNAAKLNTNSSGWLYVEAELVQQQSKR